MPNKVDMTRFIWNFALVDRTFGLRIDFGWVPTVPIKVPVLSLQASVTRNARANRVYNLSNKRI